MAQVGQRSMWTGVVGMLLAMIVLALAASPVQAQEVPIALWWVTYDQPADLARLAATYDVWEVDAAHQRALVAFRAADVDALADTHNMEIAPDQSPLFPQTVAADARSGIPGFACYRTVAETEATLAQLVTEYPRLAAMVKIGDSWDKTQPGGPPGHDLNVLILTNHGRSGDKFPLMVMGAIHARELVTAELALRFAEELLTAYGTDPAITWLLDHSEVHILPIANPDGRLFAEDGLLWRKNTNDDLTCPVSPPYSTYGVDLNRNSSFQWNSCPNCSSGYACASTYRGTAPASEPEVQAIQAYMATVFPDVRADALDAAAAETTPGIFISLHSYGQLVLYPWGWTDTPAPNAAALDTLAHRFADRLGYFACQAGAPNCLYATDGTTDDWSYGTLGVASFTFELGTTFFQTCSDFETTIAPHALDALHNALTWSARPYQFPSGPLVGNLATSRVDAQGQITASLVASQTLGSPTPYAIVGGRLALDEAPWQPGVPLWPMTGDDRLGDNSLEILAAPVDTRCLPNGDHTLIAQAQDIAGNWGSPAFAQITLAQTRTFTVSVSAPIDASSNVQVRHAVTITNTGTTTDSFRLTRSLRAAGDVMVSFSQTSTAPIEPGTSVVLAVDMENSAQNKTAAQTAAVVNIFSQRSPQQCHAVVLRARIVPERQYYLPWLPVAPSE